MRSRREFQHPAGQAGDRLRCRALPPRRTLTPGPTSQPHRRLGRWSVVTTPDATSTLPGRRQVVRERPGCASQRARALSAVPRSPQGQPMPVVAALFTLLPLPQRVQNAEQASRTDRACVMCSPTKGCHRVCVDDFALEIKRSMSLVRRAAFVSMARRSRSPTIGTSHAVCTSTRRSTRSARI